MGFLNRLFGTRGPASAADMALDKVDALLEAGEYLGKCKAFTASEFEAVDQILRKAGAEYGGERREAMLSAYQAGLRGSDNLRTLVAEEVAATTKGVLGILPSLTLTPGNKARIAKTLKRLQR